MANSKSNYNIKRAETPDNEPCRCAWPACREAGEFRAPRSREELRSYHWFCMEHIRAYNKSWNYYDGMTDEEVEADIRKDTVGRRPTWPMGAARLIYAFDPQAAFNDFGSGDGSGNRRGKTQEADAPERKAMAVLDLLPPITPGAVKARYKQLVKRHHPDANGGDKASEEKFKQISQAYKTVMAHLRVHQE
ncbi:MAG: hypothetical protein A3G18_01385 [Rhodospirillales bacterium RIFCSPLOWO2_12_FULL_58_28]|nr:MAG: hypothetical protein A3H92_04585 [Rhodospirillales bacterium RIFCSPLOWO2_02_FULL_58_16]OHC78052.1 MAG: hypothetical protein A3G18_01385 [Rhodospirillales bacterium RIFCSPLOWO2_12_FULL_58_28]